MSKSSFENIEACVFDAYGTLFDFNTAASRYSNLLNGKAEELNQIWRTKQLQYTWLHSLMDEYIDFWTLTGNALDFALDAVEIEDLSVKKVLLRAYLELDPYPEVLNTLEALKKKNLKIAILSNGEPKMLKAAVQSAGLSDVIDEIYSVDAVGVYKPHPSSYQIAVDGLGVPASRISFQSSNSWDAAGAAHFGFRVVWCNRFGQTHERLPSTPDKEITTLTELLQIVSEI